MIEFPTDSPTRPLADGHPAEQQQPAEQPVAPVTPATGDDQAVAPYTPYMPSEATAPFSDFQLPQYAAIPPSPPFGDGMPPFAPPRPPRRGRFALLAIVALLLTLGVGVLAGVGIGTSHTSASSGITIGATSAPNVSISADTTTLQQSVESVAAAVEPSVVKITSVGGRSEAIGSGDILTADGYIVTNDHVVQGFSNFSVTLANGTNYSATVVGQDAQDDLAVIKIAATGLQPIAFADSSKAQVGEFAIAVGYPLGLKETATFGIVSALNRTASEAPDGPAGILTGLIQTSAPINPGNSGGALVNLQGQLLGIPTLGETNPQTGTTASGIGYAIPANRVTTVATQLIQHGSVASTGQGFIGIQGQDVTPALAAADGLSVQSGVLVAGFVNDTAGQSPAQQAGLRSGDVITAVDGQTINGSDDLATAIVSKTPGAKVTLTVARGSSQLTISVTLGQRPTNPQG